MFLQKSTRSLALTISNPDIMMLVPSLAPKQRMLTRCFCGIACLFLLNEFATSFMFPCALHSASLAPHFMMSSHGSQRGTLLTRNLFWFTNKDEGESSEANKNPNALGDGAGGGVARVMESMEKFKRAQQVGKLTTNLVQELTSTRVEGTAENGKIKVVVDGQQRPIAVIIDESYWQQQVIQQVPPLDVNDLSAALTLAMQDAHNKAAERMDERMKSYYAELGLKPPT